MDLDGMVLIGKRRNHQKKHPNDIKIVHNDLEILDGVTKHFSLIFSEPSGRNEMKIVRSHLKIVSYEAKNAVITLFHAFISLLFHFPISSLFNSFISFCIHRFVSL
jgi:hypothetical protein